MQNNLEFKAPTIENWTNKIEQFQTQTYILYKMEAFKVKQSPDGKHLGLYNPKTEAIKMGHFLFRGYLNTLIIQIEHFQTESIQNENIKN